MTVLGAGPESAIYLDAQQEGLDVQIMGNGAGGRIVLGRCKSLTGVFSCLRDDTTLMFADSPDEAIGSSADLINNRASMFVGAKGVCYGLRGIVEGETSIVIGDRCLISDQIELRGSDSHSIISLESGRVINSPGNILVEPRVWLCQGVVILKNVTIGTGAIVATHSVVTGDVPPYCFAAGIPARVAKTAVSWQRSYPSSISDRVWQLGPEGAVSAAEPINPASPDEMAFGQLRTPISTVKSRFYAGSCSRILTDPTGERRNQQFRQRFRGLRSCRPNPSGESRINSQTESLSFSFAAQSRAIVHAAYMAILGRAPDNDGLAHYQTYLKSSGLQTGTENLIAQLLDSEERKLLEKKRQEV
jgi:acetyltransferase-like isoleucine patch superfamily enzyme